MRKQTKLVAVLSAVALLAIGASMTSYAAGGWVAEGDNDWVYLDSDGERVTNEWKRSGDNYYYLDEDGLMAKNALIDDDGDIYYVNENGTKVMNDWVCIENTEDVQPGNMYEAPSVLYYHFGSSGKADKASETNEQKVKNIDGKYYVFDSEGHMLSGWQQVRINGEDEIYYLGTETEGWVLSKAPGSNDDDEKFWYYLVSVKDGNNTIKAIPYNSYAESDESQEAVNRVMVIKKKTYMFNSFGQMLTGFVVVKNNDGIDLSNIKNTNDNPGDNGEPVDFTDELYAGISSGRAGGMSSGLYYFSEKGGSEEGQMQVGRTAVTKDDETSYYYFNKDSGTRDYGKALTSVIKDGYLYGKDGKCIEAENGNSYEVYTLDTNIVADKDVNLNAGEKVIISKTGKVKKSGSVTIDGQKYEVSNYIATEKSN